MVIKEVAGHDCQSPTGRALVDVRFGWCVPLCVYDQRDYDYNQREYEEVVDVVHGYPSVQWYLRILPFVATRPGELRLAKWGEIDFSENVWRLPEGRMKMRKAWAVPLAPQVVKMLRALEQFSGGDADAPLFPSVRSKSAVIVDAAGGAALRAMGWQQETVCLHGLRSTFSTIANESGQWRPDVIEGCLSHTDRDSVRRVYNRATFWEERRALMEWW